MEDQVIRAALDEMKIHSVRFTMEDLTRRLRMSKSSLYKIVESKELLIHAIIDFLQEEFQREADEVYSKNLPLEEGLRRFVRAYTKVFRYFEHGIYNDLHVLYPKEWERWEKFRRQKIEKFLSLMQQGIEKGIFRPISLAVLQRCLLVMSESFSDVQFLAENDLTYSQAVENFSDLLLNGFLNKK